MSILTKFHSMAVLYDRDLVIFLSIRLLGSLNTTPSSDIAPRVGCGVLFLTFIFRKLSDCVTYLLGQRAYFFLDGKDHCDTMTNRVYITAKNSSSTKTHVFAYLIRVNQLLTWLPKSIINQPSDFNMNDQIKRPTVRTRIRKDLATVQSDQIVNGMHSAEYRTMNTKSIVVILSDHYDNQL